MPFYLGNGGLERLFVYGRVNKRICFHKEKIRNDEISFKKDSYDLLSLLNVDNFECEMCCYPLVKIYGVLQLQGVIRYIYSYYIFMARQR